MSEHQDLRRDLDNDAMGDDRDYPELRYCAKCNQRRYFVDGECEVCSLQEKQK